MGTTAWIVLIAVLVVIVVAALLYYQQYKSRTLRERFGSEYDRSVKDLGDRRRAEAELQERAARVEQLDIHPLSPADHTQFADAWRTVQAQFVDDPPRAIAEADRVVIEVMRLRGYPVTDFEQRAADISVDHPDVVQNYRAADAIARRSQNGDATTEVLRQAMVHYRALFEDLLETAPAEEKELSHDTVTHRAA
jgi:hypothetical protein